MGETTSNREQNVLMQIQNSKNPQQAITVVVNQEESYAETQGLRMLFNVDEIRVDLQEILSSLQQTAMVLSFLLETMSAGHEMGLPYAYQDVFEYEGVRYSLKKEDGHRVLKRLQ